MRIISARAFTGNDSAPSDVGRHPALRRVRGKATLKVAGEAVELRSGDYLFLPAGTPHVVRRVTNGALWLAVHLHPAPACGDDNA